MYQMCRMHQMCRMYHMCRMCRTCRTCRTVRYRFVGAASLLEGTPLRPPGDATRRSAAERRLLPRGADLDVRPTIRDHDDDVVLGMLQDRVVAGQGPPLVSPTPRRRGPAAGG